jgi:predicted PurR-regulated permease PerM
MKRRPTLEQQEHERRVRRRVFHVGFWSLAILCGGLLFWQLSSLFLPILVGALMAYLFRPLKDRFQIPWLHHELRVLALFALIGCGFFLIGMNVAKHIPNEREKLELRVRIKYKLNEKFQELVGQEANKRGTFGRMAAKEAGPMMDQLNRWLSLDPQEAELFVKYHEGFNGQKIEDRFYEYFVANRTTNVYAQMERDPSSVASATPAAVQSSPAEKAGLEIWILAPLIFIFLGFDNGQMRRYIIGLVPNRYFEMSLTIMDELDEAIGRYLRGTLMECALVGLTFTLGFILIGIPVSVSIAIGAISGLVNAIPFLGTVIGLVIGLGYALVAENVTPLIPGLNANDLAIYVLILVGIVHVLDNAIYAPVVLGKAVNLHPLVVAIAIVSGSLLMGIWGMLFAIPSVVVVKTAVETLFKELKAYRII